MTKSVPPSNPPRTRRRATRWLFPGLVLLTALTGAPALHAQSNTEFTYQGYLEADGGPANGNYDFRFFIRSSSGGASVGGTTSDDHSGVPVENGVFTVLLDFGFNAFDLGPSDFRWLEIRVRPAGSGSYATLLPRQRLVRTPMAMMAQALPDVVTGGGNVGVGTGTLAPVSGAGYPSNWKGLHVGGKAGVANGVVLVEGESSSRLHLVASNNIADKTREFAMSNVDNEMRLSWHGDTLGEIKRIMTVDKDGNMGIGSAFDPAASLDVSGTLRMRGGEILLREPNAGADLDPNHGLGYRAAVDGPFLYGYTGGGLGWNHNGVGGTALRWTSNGSVGIGSSSAPTTRLTIKTGGDNDAIRLVENDSSQYWDIYYDTDDNDLSFEHSDGGALFYIRDTDGVIAITSDRRAKTDFEPLESTLDAIAGIPVMRYHYKKADPDSPKSYGYIAQDVEEVFPDLVEEKNGMKTLAVSAMIPINTRAIQELKEQKDSEVGALRAENEALRERLDALEERLGRGAGN